MKAGLNLYFLNFIKNNKILFNIFLNKKYFKKQLVIYHEDVTALMLLICDKSIEPQLHFRINSV
jgi:hypothetical protein